MNTIDKQKQTADKIYGKLKVVDPHCILAGGAPRDWYFNNACNDLDFYFASTASTVSAVRGQLEASFPDVSITLMMDKEGQANTSEMYKTMPFLTRIWEMVIDDTPVQLIQVENGKQWKVVDHMDISICQAWYIGGEVKLHNNFKLTQASDIIFTTQEGYSWSDKHAMKIKERFENGYMIGTYQQAKEMIIKRVLRGSL